MDRVEQTNTPQRFGEKIQMERNSAQDFQKQFAVIACGLPLVTLIKALNQPPQPGTPYLSVFCMFENGELIKVK